MSEIRARYVYVLTFWQERPVAAGQPTVWRFRLGGIYGETEWGFESLEALMQFLQSRMETAEQDSPGEAARRQSRLGAS